MPLTFEAANNKYKADAIEELSQTEDGRRFLLMRSLSRAEHMQSLAATCGIDVTALGNRDLFAALYKSTISIDQLKNSVKTIFDAQRAVRAANEATLVNELYKMKEFYWGGLHQNSLEKTIIDNYVKRIQSYDDLNVKIDNELFESMKGYVRCSWYNHWTSIIIEDIFKEHKNVLPAVGLVKKIDFFVHDVPFDLKVTYLPEGYVKDRRRQKGLRPELTLLKQAARARGLAIDADLSDADLLEHLWNVIADQPDAEARKLIAGLKETRLEMVADIQNDASLLIVWLYENQGERRFDASNRLFLVLVNEDSFFQSWQLKRNRTLLVKEIGAYLDKVPSAAGKPVSFTWEGSTYSTTADVIVVRHAPAKG
ncbi:MAG TPA: hypothetical protein VGM18_08790 [Candidatus Sulfotelmatobacter sp.]|jgi:hypothetical protein